MEKRFVSIWFRHLATDWFSLRRPNLRQVPFVLRTPSHGRTIVTATNAVAERNGLTVGMVLADARAVVPDLEVLDDKIELREKLLKRLAEWCIRFTPWVAVDLPDGLIFDASGCPHLFGGEVNYLSGIIGRLNKRGYNVRAAMADTVVVARGVARFGKTGVVPTGKHMEALRPLPPESLRIAPDTIERLHKLGLHKIQQFMQMPRASLRKRFGMELLDELDRATGERFEAIIAVTPIEPYQERLPCMEPIVTATGIGIALQQLLEMLCIRLQHEQKGVRNLVFKCYRVDGKIEQVGISTSRPSRSIKHLLQLLELKIPSIEPAMGIELFVLESTKVEDFLPQQEKMWQGSGGLEDIRIAELIDRLTNRVGVEAVHRYVADQHYWPERSARKVNSLAEKSDAPWRAEHPRPLQVLAAPESIEVTAPIPDYPPMLFRYKGKLHKIVRADGPERIEQEWWLQQGQHRDYYRVEDEEGHRYWLFRLGHYSDEEYHWFIHGVFA